LQTIDYGREGESQVLPFTFYTTLPVVETPQNRTMIVRLISTAQTGFFYTTQRLRQGPKLSAVKYDPKGPLHSPELIMQNLSLIFALTSKTARAVR
jgi:ribosomal protein L33